MSCDLKVTNESARSWEKNFQLYHNVFLMALGTVYICAFGIFPESIELW